MTGTIRVGVVGANPSRGWALSTHVPALKVLPGFELSAVSTTRQESAAETAQRFSVPHAFHDARALAECDEVDLVVVSVKVPYHHEITKTALAAGKHVYTEWPLGANLAEAVQLAELAQDRGVRHVIGLQGRKGPLVNYVRHLVEDGYVGRIRSVTLTLVSSGRGGTTVTPDRVWATDRANGATLLSIIAGHSLDVLRYSLGDFAEVSGRVVTVDPVAQVEGTGERVTVTAPDHVLLHGRLASGAQVAAQFLTAPAGSGTQWTVLGDRGVLTVSGDGLPHYADDHLVLRGSTGSGPLEELAVPASYHLAPAAVPEGPAKNVASVYLALADAMVQGTPVDPDFATAVSLHRLLDAIQASSDDRAVQTL